MKVIQICGAQHAGGAEAHFLRFCIEMNKCTDVTVVAVIRKGSWLETQLKKTDIKIYSLGFRTRFDFLTSWQIKKISIDEKADVIQCWMNRAARLTPSSSYGFKVGRLGGYYSIKNYKSMDWLVGATDDICQHIEQSGWDSNKISCIPNFVNLPNSNDSQSSNLLKESLGLTDKIVIITPARLHTVKGLDTAIKALSLLPYNYTYIIVGQGPEEEALRLLTKKLNVQDRVIFTGWKDNITPFCYISDIFLVPSRHEPFGSVLLEAWSHKIPLVTSSSQGALAITTPNVNCLMFKTDDPTDISKKILQLNDESHRSHLINEGHKTLIEKYTSDTVIRNYINLFSFRR